MMKMMVAIALIVAVSPGEPASADHPFDSVEMVVQERSSKKGQFETTAEFQIRRDAAAAPAKKAFPVENAHADYNADRQRLIVRVDTNVTEDPAIRSFPLRFAKKSESEYVGTNAFGATRTITRVIGDRYELTFEGQPVRSRYEFQVRVPRDKAREVIDHVGLVVRCEVLSDGPLTLHQRLEPTFTSPSDHSITTHRLNVRLLGFLVVDRRTGATLGAFDEFGMAEIVPLH